MDSHISKENLRSKIVTDRFGGKTLNLSKWDLLELPEAVQELTELDKLDLSLNKLKTIPENVGKLNNITVLDVSGNQLSIFPASLTQLKKLRWLYIAGNKLTTISDAIGEMVALRGLDLSYNQLTVLSPAIKQLKKLKWLDISRNKLTTISDAIGEMVALRGLGLSYNQLTVLSPAITQLKKLQWLNISQNKLTTISDAIGEMAALEVLDLSYNQLTVLNPAIKQLKKLKTLFVNGNPFTVEGMRSVVAELEDRGIIDRVYSDLQASKRRDVSFRARQADVIDTSTKQRTVESSLTPSSLDRIIQELQQMQLDASKFKSRADLSLGLQNIASDRGFRISDNQGSGNCMFYALSEQLEIVKGIKIPHGKLRQNLVQYLRSNPKLPDGTDLFDFVHGHQTWTEYLVHMEQDGAWGDHVILCAAANYFETCIRVVSSLSHSNDAIITPHCPVDESKPLVLGHIHEMHYVSLQPVQGNWELLSDWLGATRKSWCSIG